MLHNQTAFELNKLRLLKLTKNNSNKISRLLFAKIEVEWTSMTTSDYKKLTTNFYSKKIYSEISITEM